MTININIDMFEKHHFEGEYFADENSVKYDNQNGKIDTIAFCDDKERAKLIASCLNLFETLQDNIELKIEVDDNNIPQSININKELKKYDKI